MRRPAYRSRSLAWLAAVSLLALASPPTAAAQAPAAILTLNDTQFRPGETIAIGLTVAVPPGNPSATLFVGVLMPDGQQALFFTPGGGLSGPLNAFAPAQFPAFSAAPPGFSLTNLAFFQFTFPATGVPPGPYQLFAALVRAGTFADNQINPGDVLSLDLRSVVFGASIQLAPPDGPSGTFVSVTGTGFAPSSAISFGTLSVDEVFTSTTALGFVVPFALSPGGGPVALAPGPQDVRVSGGPSRTFTVTSPPTSATAPGTVTQNAVNTTGQTISSNRVAIDSALTGLKAEAASAEATSYLNALSGLVADLQDVFTQDLANLGTSLDAATQAALDQALLTPAPPLPFLPLAAGPLLAGDTFLDRRQTLVAAGAQAARAAQVLSQVCPFSTTRACSIAGAAFALTNTLADLIVGSIGDVVDFRVAASSSVTLATSDRLFLRLLGSDRPTLQPFIVVRRQLSGLDPVRLALEITAARVQLQRALVESAIVDLTLGPVTIARLQRLLQIVRTLETLAPQVAGSVPLEEPQELPVSFARVRFGCPQDLFTALAVDEDGRVSVLRQADFDVTRVCDFALRSQFVTRGETPIAFEVAFTLARYGAVTLGPVRPFLAWGSLLLVAGLVLSQWTSGRRSKRPR